MGRRPKADGFENVALPGLEPPAPVEKMAKSKKQEADEAKVSYHKHTAKPRALCAACVQEQQNGERPGIYSASYERRHGPEVRYLCNLHTQAARHADTLGGLLGPAK